MTPYTCFRRLAIVFCTVLAWCALSTLYWEVALDKRATTTSSNIRRPKTKLAAHLQRAGQLAGEISTLINERVYSSGSKDESIQDTSAEVEIAELTIETELRDGPNGSEVGSRDVPEIADVTIETELRDGPNGSEVGSRDDPESTPELMGKAIVGDHEVQSQIDPRPFSQAEVDEHHRDGEKININLVPSFTESAGPKIDEGHHEEPLHSNAEVSPCDKLPQGESEVCGPKVLIIGAMKCGTNTIGDILQKHPRIKLTTCREQRLLGLIEQEDCTPDRFQAAKRDVVFEGHDFTHHMMREPETWLQKFAKRMPVTDGINSITFDKSPSYLNTNIFPEVARTAKHYLPSAKIIASLCNPAERLYSEFHHLVERTLDEFNQFYHDNSVDPPTDFQSFVNMFKPDDPTCKENPLFCEKHRKIRLHTGEYLISLLPWYEAYGHENVLVVDMDDDPTNITKKILQHVGSDLMPESEYSWEQATPTVKFANEAYQGRDSSYEEFSGEMQWLEQYYASHNHDLANYLGADWPRTWNGRLESN
jgi:Sulfotransferase domain